jgi:hypothetical protein
MTPDAPGTLNLDDGLAIGAYLESKGIDALNVSNGNALNANANCSSYSYRPGRKKHAAKAIPQLSIKKEMPHIPTQNINIRNILGIYGFL